MGAGASGQVHGDLSWVPTAIFSNHQGENPLKCRVENGVPVTFFAEKSPFHICPNHPVVIFWSLLSCLPQKNQQKHEPRKKKQLHSM